MILRVLLPAAAIALGAACATAVAQPAKRGGGNDVEVRLDQFGAGNAFRPGDVTGIRVVLTSSLSEPTPCWVQWEVPNAEGDVAEYGRVVTLSPGAPLPVWLYAPLPPLTQIDSVWTVRVFEQRDEKRRGELGGIRISPALAAAQQVDAEAGMIGVVGRARMRLDDFSASWSQRTTPPGANEDTRIISGIMPQDMPDRWEGLLPFEAIVWSDAAPQQLRVDAAHALREWVRRGGHLVIVLPGAGNPWGLGARGQTWLEDLLVGQVPRRDESVLLSQVMPLLSKSSQPPPRDIEVGVRVFKEIGGGPGGAFDAIDNGYVPLMAMADGRVVAVQRLVDCGRITIIGLDLASQQLASMRLPQGDAFWNRVLGRRADTPLPDELLRMTESDPRRLTRNNPRELWIGDSRLFERFINKQSRAGGGLATAAALFAAYFLMAGPLGFYLLRQRGWARHSWVAFAATAAAFTAVAWGGVRLLRQRNVEYNHVTFLDHVARPGDQSVTSDPLYQRAVSWGALYLPGYGKAGVSIDSDGDQRDLLLTWAAPPALQEPFPNVDRYLIDEGRSLAGYQVPARATATQLYANWMGALDPQWGGTLRVDPEDPIQVIPAPPGGQATLSGTLISDLPGPLSDMTVIWINDDRAPRRRYVKDNLSGLDQAWVPPSRSGEMLNLGHTWRIDAGNPLYPGNRFPLDNLTPVGGKTSLAHNIYSRYIENEEGSTYDPPLGGMAGARGLTHNEARSSMEMLAIYDQLTPPKYIRVGSKDPEAVSVRRRLGRELDLSAWFVRPCLIITGFLENSATPVPLRVDGRAPRSQGLTMVRWIYPLPVDESKIPTMPGS